jgi:protein-L-isoaspartate(D-aspartate) O-methyltransferase
MASEEIAVDTIFERQEKLDRFIDEVIVPVGAEPNVINAFSEVDRAEFAHPSANVNAYVDKIIQLKYEASISQPSLVAAMINKLCVEGHSKVLEIGTATGYQAAVLSRLAAEVHTVEIDEDLAKQAKANLERLSYANVTVHQGDGAEGYVQSAPYDRIIVTAALNDIPPPLWEQLAVGGIMIAPIGQRPDECELNIIEKLPGGEIKITKDQPCHFVPLVSNVPGGWTKEEVESFRQEKLEERKELLSNLAENRGSVKKRLEKLWAATGEDWHDISRAVKQDLSILFDVPETTISDEVILDAVVLIINAVSPPEKEKPS